MNEKEFIVTTIKEWGFNAIANEIMANRRALDNAKLAIHHHCKDLLSKRYNVKGEVIYTPSKERIKQVEQYKEKFLFLCKRVLK